MSRMPSFTPGPWKIDKQHTLDVYAQPDENHIGPTLVATAKNIDYPFTKAEANARLIAAAPELLAICQEIANDSRINLQNSERRMRLYGTLEKAGGQL